MVKKNVTKKTGVKKKNNARSKLEEQLKKLIKVINDEGLVFLIEQAEVIKHNMEIDKLNQNIDTLNKSKQLKKGQKTGKDQDAVYIEIFPDDDKKNFIFQIGNERKFITLVEMRTIVKICHSSDPEPVIMKRLYQWLYNERKDVLIDCHVRTKDSQILHDLIKITRTKYKVKN